MVTGTGGVSIAVVFGRAVPLQAFDPSLVLDAPMLVRAAVSFICTVLFGGLVIYRYGGRLDDAVAASMSSPVVSVVYGIMAFGFVIFLLGYVFSQVSQLGINSTFLGAAVGALVAVAVLSLGGFGFVVVGAWATETFGSADPWVGLVGVGAISAVAWLFLPFLLAALVWIGIAAVGLGGPARHWVHRTKRVPSES